MNKILNWKIPNSWLLIPSKPLRSESWVIIFFYFNSPLYPPFDIVLYQVVYLYVELAAKVYIIGLF